MILWQIILSCSVWKSGMSIKLEAFISTAEAKAKFIFQADTMMTY